MYQVSKNNEIIYCVKIEIAQHRLYKKGDKQELRVDDKQKKNTRRRKNKRQNKTMKRHPDDLKTETQLENKGNKLIHRDTNGNNQKLFQLSWM